MSCNVYEDPDKTMKVRYNKEVRGKGRKEEREEKVVDIYESAETLTSHRVNPSRNARGVRTQKRRPTIRRNWYKVATVTLGLLCLLLLAGISVLLYHCIVEKPHSVVKKPLQTCSENHTKEQTELLKFQCQDQNCIGWQELRVSHFYYTSTEKKNWTESRKDCESRRGDLMIVNNKEKQEMIKRMKIRGDSWIGLQSSDEWEVKWKWVDGSELAYSSWKKGVNIKAEQGLKAFTDQQGLWMHDKTGLKYWICEKRHVQYLGDLKPGKNITKT